MAEIEVEPKCNVTVRAVMEVRKLFGWGDLRSMVVVGAALADESLFTPATFIVPTTTRGEVCLPTTVRS